MRGYETTRQRKQAPATAGIPVRVVTALGRIGDKAAALTCGAEDYRVKPLWLDEVRTRVRVGLKVRHLSHDLDRTLAYLHELQAARETAAAPPARSGTPAAAPQPRITTAAPIPLLLVDDAVVSHTFSGSCLGDRGFHVIAAATGEEALGVARQHPIEVALLDMVLPGMSGVELLERLHTDDPDLPAIMRTAHATPQHAITALKLGAVDSRPSWPRSGPPDATHEPRPQDA